MLNVKRLGVALVVVTITGAAWSAGAAGERLLTMYVIDVEGGQSTLIVTAAGESLLVDTGFVADGRDSGRILAATKDAGITRIDHLLLTHFHPDHDGGVAELPARSLSKHSTITVIWNALKLPSLIQGGRVCSPRTTAT